jgi:SAM-dependent methyltransferase
VQDEQGGRSLTDLLFRWGRRVEPERQPGEAERGSVTTKVFGKFLRALAHRETPVVLDLGPVVGSNISFLGERLGCKFVVEDVFNDLERFTRDGRGASFAEFLKTRFPQADGSIDGILCWDLLDYLDKASAQVLARQMVRLLKPGGALLGFFATTAPGPGALHYTKYVVVDDTTLQHRSYAGSRERQPVLNNRDISRLFEGLRVAESFLLLTRTREILFRKGD